MNKNKTELKQNQDINYYRKYITMYISEINDVEKLKKIYEYVHAIRIRK